MKKSVNVEKIWQILGNIEGCQEELNRAPNLSFCF